MNERELVELIWETFGVALDYSTAKKDILTVLYRLSS